MRDLLSGWINFSGGFVVPPMSARPAMRRGTS